MRYGDIWKIAFSKRKEKKIVVVSVNTTFDTIVDENLAIVDKPLVSPSSMHGQWLTYMKSKNVDISTIDKNITNSLQLQKINPIRVLNSEIKKRGKLNCYAKGTIAVYEYENTIFYLIALSEFDENNNAQNTKRELVSTITELIDFYDKHGNGYDIYVPLMGTLQSRTGISRVNSLEILTSMFELYEDKIQGCANIIVYFKDRDKVSLGM